MTTAAILVLLLASGPPAPTSPVDSALAPDHAERQVRRVMNSGLPFAEQALAERGEFVPFGAVMLPEGLIQNVLAGSPDENAPADVVFQQLTHALREGADNGTYQVVATFALVELRDPEDGRIVNAVQIGLEHRDGYCVNVYFPTVSLDDRVKLGEAFAQDREGVFFACRRS